MLPKLEGEIILSAPRTIAQFGAFNITIPAGRYFLNSVGSGGASRTFCNEIAFQMESAMGAGASSVTVDDNSDTSVGKVTISRSGAFAITWLDTTVRDLLGFSGNRAAATSHLGDNQAQYLWLPNCGRENGLGPEDSDGAVESDFSLSVSTDGTVYGLGYSLRYFDTMEFNFIWGQKAWTIKEVTVNESLQRFYEMVIARGLRVRYHKDRSVDGTLRTWVIEDATSYQPRTVVPGWTDSVKSLFSIKYKVRKTS